MTANAKLDTATGGTARISAEKPAINRETLDL
jgi:hypothetical protein